MKKIVFALTITTLFLLSSCSGGSEKKTESEQKSEVVSDANLVSVSMHVEGMTCTGCENTIKSKVSSLAGVSSVEASHTDSVVTVKMNADVDVADVKAAIASAGYTVKE